MIVYAKKEEETKKFLCDLYQRLLLSIACRCNSASKTYRFSHPHAKQIISHKQRHYARPHARCVRTQVSVSTRKLRQCVSVHKCITRRKERDHPVAVHFSDEEHDTSTSQPCATEGVSPPPRGRHVDLFVSSCRRLCGATVARLTPDQKVACSNHVRVKSFPYLRD